MLRGALISLVFVKMIESLRAFDLIYVMTRGGPGHHHGNARHVRLLARLHRIRPYLLCVEHGGADDDRDDCGLHCSLAAGAAVARGLSRFAARAIIALVAASVIVPILWTLLSGFKNRVDIVTPTPMLFFTPTLDNFLYVLERESVRAGLINSIIVSGCSVLIGAALWAPSGLCRGAISDALRQRHPVFRIVAEISSAGRDRHSAHRHLARCRSLRYAHRAHRHLQPADARDDHLARDPCVQARAQRDRGSGLRRRLRPLRDLFPYRAANRVEVAHRRDRVLLCARLERIPHRADADDIRRENTACRRLRDDPARPRCAVGHSQRFGYSACRCRRSCSSAC